MSVCLPVCLSAPHAGMTEEQQQRYAALAEERAKNRQELAQQEQRIARQVIFFLRLPPCMSDADLRNMNRVCAQCPIVC